VTPVLVRCQSGSTRKPGGTAPDVPGATLHRYENPKDGLKRLAHWLRWSCLTPTWRTIACDHRGTGATLIPVESITFDALVADLFRVMDAYRGERCVVTGESAGPAVAMQAVLQRPERFEGLNLLDGTAGVQRCRRHAAGVVRRPVGAGRAARTCCHRCPSKAHSSPLTSLGYGLRFGMLSCYRSPTRLVRTGSSASATPCAPTARRLPR